MISGPHRLRMLRALFPLVFLSLLAPVAADPPADPSRRLFDPDRTSAFIVGILEWQDAASFAPFPKEDRRDTQLAEFFRAAGVPAERVVVLQDQNATLERIRARLAETLARTREGEFLFLYYAGHGGRDGSTGTVSFANYDAGETMWPVEELSRAVGASFRGNRVFLSTDCCHSGGLAQAARVLESERGLHRVRYDGYGEEWDEWVGPRRLREKRPRM